MAMDESEVLQTLMRWRTRVSAATWVVVRDTHAAEDIFQNVVVKALTTEAFFETEAALLSWTFITARREGIDWLRRQRREVATLDAQLFELLESDWQREALPQPNLRVEKLQECLEALPSESRQLLKLRYFDGLNCGAVAGQLRVELDAVYKRLSRLHVALKQCVEGKLAAIRQPSGVTP